jgi:3-hydroxyisobutyrate dehydrogenase-like beta-hydroxyacid dehydrogenase
MSYTIAIIAPGEMGSAVGARLAERGVLVTTSLAGRSAASAARARRALMVAVDGDDALVGEADFVLSIVPPGDAVALAARLKPALGRASRKPVYVDCNAVSPDTARAIGGVLAGTGCRYVDGGIIGPPPQPPQPPQPNAAGTRIYVSGEAAKEVARLNDFGLSVRALDGPIGVASALKMAYAGITKGFTAVGAAMALGAARAGAGCAEALHDELAQSQPQLLAWLSRAVPRMYPKAYRFVAEMEEIGHFLGDGAPGGDMYAAIARLYADIAADERNPDAAAGPIAPLERFFAAADAAEARKRA